jgi:RNA-binding protein PNO1
MVVSTAQASSSSPKASAPRKNRRKMSKKPTDPAVDTEDTAEDDAIMDAIPTDRAHETETTETLDDTMDTTPLDVSLVPTNDNDDDLIIDDSAPASTTSAPVFPASAGSKSSGSLKSESRRVPIPPHRMTPVKRDWVNIFGPLTEILGLQVRMNVHRRCVELRVCAPLAIILENNPDCGSDI